MRFIVRCALCGTQATAEQYVTPGRLTCPTCPPLPDPRDAEQSADVVSGMPENGPRDVVAGPILRRRAHRPT